MNHNNILGPAGNKGRHCVFRNACLLSNYADLQAINFLQGDTQQVINRQQCILVALRNLRTVHGLFEHGSRQ
jgi:hypothetical protein